MESGQFRKIQVDNLKCRRRFHIGWEESDKNLGPVKISCPHCNITVFEATNHPPVVLMREENLVGAPLDTTAAMHECWLGKSQK